MGPIAKRPRADDPPQEGHPTKKLRTEVKAQSSSNFPPEFWDDLSKVWLSPRALRELDRRNNARPPPKPRAPTVHITDLARLARRGGPDLRHLRGYPEPREDRLSMSSSRASASGRRTKSAEAITIKSPKARKSSAYDDNFEQHLIDHDIYPEGYRYLDDPRTPEPGNMDEVRLKLSVARASLSLSRFSESAFRDFKETNNTKSEATVMRKVIPIITGNASIPNEGNLPFTNFGSLTGDVTVKAVTDFFDGALPGDVDKSVREDLSRLIAPTKRADFPVAPNFFMEVKAPSGGAHVARLQACYDGAYGARAMHSLQSYGKEEPMYDGNAYAFTSTYHAGRGTLQLYAHHVTAPTDPEGQPEYHMSQIDAHALTGSRRGFVEGATAFRNSRDLARRYRDQFIQEANARARHVTASTDPKGRPGYYMTKLRGFDLTDSRETCVKGIGAFRNARDLARRYRDELIQEANAGTRQPTGPPVHEPEAAEAQQSRDSGSGELEECEDTVKSKVLAAENCATSHDIDEGPVVPRHL